MQERVLAWAHVVRYLLGLGGAAVLLVHYAIYDEISASAVTIVCFLMGINDFITAPAPPKGSTYAERSRR